MQESSVFRIGWTMCCRWRSSAGFWVVLRMGFLHKGEFGPMGGG
jgi:hypothetical protein